MVRNKITTRMDKLQSWMESNYHLTNPIEVTNHIHSISKFWSILNEEDIDYIQAAEMAINEKMKWE